jgi:hypothetical protein
VSLALKIKKIDKPKVKTAIAAAIIEKVRTF